MRGLDAPLLGIEVVGAVSDVLDEAKHVSLIADGDDASWRVGRQYESLASQEGDGLRVGEGDGLTPYGLTPLPLPMREGHE